MNGKAGGSLPRGGTLEKTCAACGRSFKRFVSLIEGKKYSFCNRACLNQGRRNRLFRVSPKTGITRSCLMCGKSFYVQRAMLKYPTRFHCCSQSCASTLKFSRMYPKQTLTCHRCGTQFEKAWGTIRKYRGKNVYCSQQCYLSVSGADHPAWRGGARYTQTAEWNEVRWLVLERDRHRCVMCHSSIGLHVHHLIPFRICKVHESSNLITLCKSCHFRAHRIAVGKKLDRVDPVEKEELQLHL